jgi:phage terminase large subunit
VTLKRPIVRSDGIPILKDGKPAYRTRIYLRATIKDNPDPVFREQYTATLASAKPHIRRALLDGDWWVTEGSFFSEWQAHLHVCKPFTIPRDWPVFRAMDWGFKLPGAIVWFAVDPDDNMYAIRELTFQRKTDREVARMVREIETQMGYWKGRKSMLIGPADTQLWEKRGEDDTKSKAEVFWENGVPWFPASKRDAEASRVSNAQLLSKRLADHSNGTTTPGIVFFDTCKNCIRTIPAVQTDVNDPECPADVQSDHWLDAVLYGCRYASRGPKVLRKIKDAEKHFWDDDDEPVVHSRGRDGYGAEL